MINVILLLSTIPGLVLLYSQWRIKEEQEQFIKAEAESLKKLQFHNQQYIDAGIFGLHPESSYLRLAAPNSQIPFILTANTRIVRKPRKIREFHQD